MYLNVVKYELKRITTSNIFKIFALVSVFVTYKSSIDLQIGYPLRKFNVLEGIVKTLNDYSIITWVLIPFSLYFMTKIFFDDELNFYVKIKSKSKFNWFSQKVISLVMYIIAMVGILVSISLAVNLFIFDYGFSWTHTILNTGADTIDPIQLQMLDAHIFQYQPYYSVIKAIIMSLIFLIGGLSLLGLIIGLVSIITNKPSVGIIIGFLYYIFSTKYTFFIENRFSFLKYFTIDSYILFNNHDFNGMTTKLFTVRESFLGLILLSISLFIIGVFIIKKKDIATRY